MDRGALLVPGRFRRLNALRAPLAHARATHSATSSAAYYPLFYTQHLNRFVPTSIDVVTAAGYERCPLRGEERDQARHLLSLPKPLERHQLIGDILVDLLSTITHNG